MFEPDKLVPFTAAAASLIMTPGPAKLLLVSTSASRGFRPGFKLALGIFFSDTVHVTLVWVGLGALIVSSQIFRSIIAITGAVFLIYFAVIYLLKAYRGPAPATLQGRTESERDLIAVGLFLNLFNPLAVAFYMGLLPQFADPLSPHSTVAQIGTYGGALILIFLATHTTIAFAASKLKRTEVSQIWFRASYCLAAVVLFWLCGRMLIGTFLR